MRELVTFSSRMEILSPSSPCSSEAKSSKLQLRTFRLRCCYRCFLDSLYVILVATLTIVSAAAPGHLEQAEYLVI